MGIDKSIIITADLPPPPPPAAQEPEARHDVPAAPSPNVTPDPTGWMHRSDDGEQLRAAHAAGAIATHVPTSTTAPLLASLRPGGAIFVSVMGWNRPGLSASAALVEALRAGASRDREP